MDFELGLNESEAKCALVVDLGVLHVEEHDLQELNVLRRELQLVFLLDLEDLRFIDVGFLVGVVVVGH